MWYVYILECSDGTLYTGCTTDVARRTEEHRTGVGAKYTRAHGVKKVRYTEAHPSRSAACAREAAIKQWDRQMKLKVIRCKDIERDVARLRRTASRTTHDEHSK